MLPKSYVSQFGDVVLAKAPLPREPDAPGDRLRPCVVIGECSTSGKLIAIPTADIQRTRILGGIDVSTPFDLTTSGFEEPTRLLPDRPMLIGKDKGYFPPHPRDPSISSKVGRLPKKIREELHRRLNEKTSTRFLNYVGGDAPDQLYPLLLAFTRGWVDEAAGVTFDRDAWCPTLVFSDGLVVEFWPDDPYHPDRVADLHTVTVRAMCDAELLTAHQRIACIRQMAAPSELAA